MRVLRRLRWMLGEWWEDYSEEIRVFAAAVILAVLACSALVGSGWFVGHLTGWNTEEGVLAILMIFGALMLVVAIALSVVHSFLWIRDTWTRSGWWAD